MQVDHIYKNADLRAYAMLNDRGVLYYGFKGWEHEYICPAKHITKNIDYTKGDTKYRELCDWIHDLLTGRRKE